MISFLISLCKNNNNNKSFLFLHSSISYLRSRKLTLEYYLNFNSRNWKLKIDFSIFIFKNWIFRIWNENWDENQLLEIEWTKYKRTQSNPCTESVIQFSLQNWKLENDKNLSLFNYQFLLQNWKMKIRFSFFCFRIKLPSYASSKPWLNF